MANSRITISELPLLDRDVADTDLLPIDDGTTTYKVSVENFEATSAAAARGYAQAAADSAEEAKGYKNTAQQAVSDVGTQVTAAQNYASAASGSATSAYNYADAASGSATTAAGHATSAGTSASEASGYATVAGQKASDAANEAARAKSWADYPNSTASGSATNNAHYWADQARGAAGGGVLTFNSRNGYVVPAAHDYNAGQVDYSNTTSGMSATDVQAAIDENVTSIGQISSDLTNKQPKTLATPITVAGTQQTTVEGALGAINTENAKAYKSDDATETAIADADYIPFYDTSASAMKKIAVSNLDLGGGVEETAVSQYVETIGSTAQGSYKVGDYFLAADGYYYRCKSAITGGSTTITTNNAEQTTISKAIAQSMNYSETEHVIGTWIDGSTLYEKTVDFGALPNNTTKEVDHNISGYNKVVNIFGAATNPTNKDVIPIPFVHQAGSGQVRLSMTSTKLTIVSASNVSSYTNVYITVQYTKTA